MSDWKKEYKRAAVRTIIQQGPQHKQNDQYGDHTYYSWGYPDKLEPGQVVKEDVLAHLEKCGYDLVQIDDLSWSVWGGTFDSDSEKSGIAVAIACPCKKYTLSKSPFSRYKYYDDDEDENHIDVLFRIEANFAELLHSVLLESEEGD